MMMNMYLVVLVWTLAASFVGAFQTMSPAGTACFQRASVKLPPSAVLYLSSNGSDDTSSKRRRKRVKRKELVTSADEAKEPSTNSPLVAAVPDLKPRDDTPVQLEIKDVRDVVSGRSSSISEQQLGDTSQRSRSDMNTGGDSSSFGGGGDSLEQLLADAKAMRKDVDSDKKQKGDTSIQETVQNVLSTIVTIDFFVVCALLLWFLAGIFGSYVLKNDTVQIAFNSIFQQVVQPALGILMIGSAASAVLKEEGQED